VVSSKYRAKNILLIAKWLVAYVMEGRSAPMTLRETDDGGCEIVFQIKDRDAFDAIMEDGRAAVRRRPARRRQRHDNAR